MKVYTWCKLCVAVVFLPVLFAQEKKDPSPLKKRLEKIKAFLEEHQAPREALEKAEKAISDLDPVLADEALALSFPRYSKAVSLAQNGDPSAVVRLAGLSLNSKIEYVKLHSLYHLGRMLLDSDDPDGAAKAFHDFFALKSRLSPFEPEASFFLGMALARIPSREEAIIALTNFLKAFPWAPERYRAVAWQVLEELKRPEQNPLFGIADEMKSVGRKLKKGNPGERTVKQEKKILDELDELIEKMEQREKQKSGGAGSPSGNQAPSNPASSAKAPKGKARIGALKNRAGILGEKWARLSKKERERILQGLKSSFPPRYRDLLEAYFRKLSKRK